MSQKSNKKWLTVGVIFVLLVFLFIYNQLNKNNTEMNSTAVEEGLIMEEGGGLPVNNEINS